MPRVLWVCYALSGASALGLEMLWMRSAALVLGSDATTTALVLAWYFTGLAVGSALGRHGTERPIRRYALLEVVVAGGGLWSLATFECLASDVAQTWLAADAWRGAVALAVATLPATLALGATLPVLGEAMLPLPRLATRGGWLLAINTLGGAAGLALAGFGLPAAIGVRATYGVVVATSLFVGAVAFAAGRAESIHAAPARSVAVPDRRLLAVAAVCGALGLGLEVLWTRLFAQVLHNSVYSFTAVALVFVVAYALGAALAAALARRATANDVAAGALAAAAASTLGGFWLFVRATDGLAYVGMQSGLGEYVLRIAGLAAITAGPAALAAGLVLPALWTATGTNRGVAGTLADLTAANTLGGIVGCLGAGFLVMPTIGVRSGMLLAVVGYAGAALALARPGSRVPLFTYAVVLVAVFADPLRAPIVSVVPGVERLVTLHEGANGVTSVVEVRDNLQLRVDNYYVLGGSEAVANERRMGLVPLLLHPDPERVLFVGLATGITASAAPALEVPDTTVVELIPEVAESAREHFGPWNGNLLDRTDVHLVVEDGRRFLQARPGTYDVVVSDLFIPWHAGTSSLYAREMYETVARRLAAGGIFCQWLPLYQLTREEFDVIARTFLEVFPWATVWRDDFYPNRPVVGLVGGRGPAPVDLGRAAERAARLPAATADPLLAAPHGLAMLYAGDLRAIADDFAAAEVNSDDRPVIEFRAPRLTRMGKTGDKDWFVGAALVDFYDRLLARDPRSDGTFVDGDTDVAGARRAGLAMVRYALAEADGDTASAERFQADVRMLVPDVVAAADAGTSGESPSASLSALRQEQESVRRRLDRMAEELARLGRDGGARP